MQSAVCGLQSANVIHHKIYDDRARITLHCYLQMLTNKCHLIITVRFNEVLAIYQITLRLVPWETVNFLSQYSLISTLACSFRSTSNCSKSCSNIHQSLLGIFSRQVAEPLCIRAIMTLHRYTSQLFYSTI